MVDTVVSSITVVVVGLIVGLVTTFEVVGSVVVEGVDVELVVVDAVVES